jgi:hypothetical protein
MPNSDADLAEELAELQAEPPVDSGVHPEDGDQTAAEMDFPPDEEDER